MKPRKSIAGAMLVALIACGCYEETPRRGGAGGRPDAPCPNATCMRELTREIVVTDSFGRPIPGARVKLTIPDWDLSSQGRTLGDGTVLFAFTVGSDALMYFSFHARGFLPAAIEDMTGTDPYRAYHITLLFDEF